MRNAVISSRTDTMSVETFDDFGRKAAVVPNSEEMMIHTPERDWTVRKVTKKDINELSSLTIELHSSIRPSVDNYVSQDIPITVLGQAKGVSFSAALQNMASNLMGLTDEDLAFRVQSPDYGNYMTLSEYRGFELERLAQRAAQSEKDEPAVERWVPEYEGSW